MALAGDRPPRYDKKRRPFIVGRGPSDAIRASERVPLAIVRRKITCLTLLRSYGPRMHRDEPRATVKIETGRSLLPVCIETRRSLLPEETWQQNGFLNTISGLEKIINKKRHPGAMRRDAKRI